MEDVVADIIEVRIKEDGKVLWLNTHECIARVCGLKEIIIVDERKKERGGEGRCLT